MGGPGDRYSMVILKDLMIPMHDGVRLSTDVYLPARDGQLAPGPWPTIFGRTSYDKEADWLWVKPVAALRAEGRRLGLEEVVRLALADPEPHPGSPRTARQIGSAVRALMQPRVDQTLRLARSERQARFVTHRMIGDAEVERAVAAVSAVVRSQSFLVEM
jgi:hypothetical protein